MGLFSRKNKQDRVAEDSGRFYSKDDDAAIGERARAKRASNAGGGASRRPGSDPLLPEKKRARRRLVGAIALALAAAVGLPMLLDSEPKPLAGDIAIQIPSKDKAPPLPVPDKQVAAEDSVGKDEEIIDPQGVATPPPVAEPKAAAKPADPKPADPKPEPVKAEPKAVAPERKDDQADARLAAEKAEKADRAERQRAEKAERERLEKAERERADKAERADRQRAEKQRAEEKARDEKAREERAARARVEDKPVKPVHSDSRAVAILEGKAAEKDKPSDAGAQKVVLQVAAMSSQDKAAEVQARLRDAGISSYTQKSGDLIKVKIGPLNKDDADRMRAKLGKIGLSGFAVPS